MNISDSNENIEQVSKRIDNEKIILSFHDISVAVTKAEDAKPKPFSLIGVIILCLAVLGGGSMAPCFNLYGGISTFTKNLWRWQMNFIISIPLVIYTVYKEPHSIDYNFLKTFKCNALLLLSGVIFTGGCCTFVASAWLTIASHTYTLGSLAGVIIILIKIGLLKPVHNLEKIGTFTVVVGSFMLMYFRTTEKADNQEDSIMGDIFALLSSWFYAMYFPLNKMVIYKIPGLIIFMYTAFSAFWCFFFINILFRDIDMEVFFSMDPTNGLFGWLSEEQIYISLFLIGPLWGLWGNGGPILALKYFESHIVGNAFMFEPFIGQMLSCAFGQDEIPGFITFFWSLSYFSRNICDC